MTKLTPIWAKESTAAKLMDMTTAQFRELVEKGYLPRGREIAPGVTRWSVDELSKIVSGNVSEGMSDVKW